MSGTLRFGPKSPPIQLQREQLVLKREEIRGLLVKADLRLREDTDNRRRWLGVVENLENSLTEVKARLEGVELAIEKGAAAPLPVTGPATELSDSGFRFVSSVMQMSVLDMSKLTLEDLARTQAESSSPQLSDDQRARVSSKVELANQLRPEPTSTPDSELPSRRNQLILRGAIDKIQTGRIASMSQDEVEMLTACHELLVRRVNPTPSDQRLKRIVGGALNLLQRRQNEVAIR